MSQFQEISPLVVSSGTPSTVSGPFSSSDVLRSVRMMFNEARRLREFGIMKACLSRLIQISQELNDQESLRQYVTLFRVLHPILQEKETDSGPPPGMFRSSPQSPASPLPYVVSSSTHSSGTPHDFVATFTRAQNSGWLPRFPFAFEHCLLTARTPFVTPAEIAQFAEYRSGILVFLADDISPVMPPPSPIPVMALVFHGGYLGPLPPAPKGWETDYGTHILRTMAVWQMDQQSGWASFFETSATNLQSWYAQQRFLWPESGSQFSQMFFYCLTDLENERAQQA